MIKILLLFLVVVLPAIGAENLDRELLSRLDGTHDLELPDWGPYSKKYNGISHVTSKVRGMRFDLAYAAGYLHRSKMIIPDVLVERDYFIWDVATDLSYLKYRYQLEWKDKLISDVIFSEIDDWSRLITVRFENNTENQQDIVYNLLASMNYPDIAVGGSSASLLPFEVHLPDDGYWLDGMDYVKLRYAVARHDDNLIYDAYRKGEIFANGLVNSRALGRGFGADAGDTVLYITDIPASGPYELLVRYRTPNDSDACFEVSGFISAAVRFDAAKSFTTKVFEMDNTKKKSAQIQLVSSGCASIEIDGFAIVPAGQSKRVEFFEQTFDVVPKIITGPVKNSIILKYGVADFYYGILWDGPANYVVEIHSDSMENLPIYNARNIDVDLRIENDKGHFTDILVHGIRLNPYASSEHLGLVVVGDEARVRKQLKEFPQNKSSYVKNRNAHYANNFSKPNADKFSFSMGRMESILANNIVFPVRIEGEYSKHYTPGRRWNSLYTWDLGMMGIGMMELDLDRSVNMLNTYLTGPESENAFIHHGTPAPTHIYQYFEIWNKSTDMEFLRHYYPRVRRYYKFLAGTYGSSVTRFRSNLTKTWDYFYNSAGWDDYPPQRWVEANDPEHRYSPTITPTHLIRSAKILKKAAEILGYGRHISEYEKDISDVSGALQKYSWDEDSGYFSYVKHDDDGNAIGILRSKNGSNMNYGMDGAAPLIAGILTDQQRLKILDKLLDKSRLWTKLGISVDQEAPHAGVNAYDNETVWISHQWFFWKSFLDLGLGQHAYDLAHTSLNVYDAETRRTYHSWEHYTQDSLRGTGWHQFSGLNSPLVNWYHIYYVPGNIYSGFDCWIRSYQFSTKNNDLKLYFEIEDRNRSTHKDILVSMNPKFDYQCTLNDQDVDCQRVTDTTLMVSVPTDTANNKLHISEAGLR